MPQLDKVTFLSQFFWLCFFYLSFYLIILKYFLPKVSRILKLRKRKMNYSQKNINFVEQEINEIQDKFAFILSKGFLISRNAFDFNFNQFNKWSGLITNNLNKTYFKKVNSLFVYSVAESSLAQSLAIAQSKLTVSPRLFLIIFMKKIKNLELAQLKKINKSNLNLFKSFNKVPKISDNKVTKKR